MNNFKVEPQPFDIVVRHSDDVKRRANRINAGKNTKSIDRDIENIRKQYLPKISFENTIFFFEKRTVV